MKNISAAFLVNLLYNKSMVVLTGFLPGIGMQLGLGKPWAISNEKKAKKNAYKIWAECPTSVMMSNQNICVTSLRTFPLVVVFLWWLIVFPRYLGGSDIKN